jgi:hypothetical protein
MKYKGGRIPIGKSTRWINPKTLYKRKREEKGWMNEHEVRYGEEEGEREGMLRQ